MCLLPDGRQYSVYRPRGDVGRSVIVVFPGLEVINLSSFSDSHVFYNVGI